MQMQHSPASEGGGGRTSLSEAASSSGSASAERLTGGSAKMLKAAIDRVDRIEMDGKTSREDERKKERVEDMDEET